MWIFPFHLECLFKRIVRPFDFTFGSTRIKLNLWHFRIFYFDLFMSSLNGCNSFKWRVDFMRWNFWLKGILRHWGFDVHRVSEILSWLDSDVMATLICLGWFHSNTKDTGVAGFIGGSFEGVKDMLVIMRFLTLDSWDRLGLIGNFFFNALCKRNMFLNFEILMHELGFNNRVGNKINFYESLPGAIYPSQIDRSKYKKETQSFSKNIHQKHLVQIICSKWLEGKNEYI